MSTDPVAAASEPVESPVPAAAPESAASEQPAADSAASSTVAEAASPTAEASPNATTGEVASVSGSEEPKRKIRLAPVVDPKLVRPIPNLSTGDVAAMAANGEAGAPAATVESAAAQPEVVAKPAAPLEPPVRRPPPVAIPQVGDLDANVEAELAAALQTSQAAPEAAAAPAEEGAAPVTEETLAPGAKIKGKVHSIDAENVFFDLGLRLTGIVPFKQFDPKRTLEIGTILTLTVDKIDEAEGLIHCHLQRGRGRVSGDWSSVVVEQTVECKVASVNKGGLEVIVGALRGFLPASQVELGYAANLESYVGQTISARVTEVNPARRRLILSRRVLLAEEREQNSGKLLEEIQPGQVRTGVVKSLKDFGAFVDIGGIDGFLHVGQITWQRIHKPSDVLSEGQQVEVKVVSVDREKKRIGLSLRQLVSNPWAEVEAKYAKGTNVTGKVTKIEGFGAFIELEPGLEGLVHISELEHRRVQSVNEVLSVGQMVELQVLEVDPKKKRISLSAKALKAKPESTKPARAPKVADEDLAPGKGQVYERKMKGNLKGGIGGPQKGGLFGDPRSFN